MKFYNKTLNKSQRKGIYTGSTSPIFYSIDSILDIILFAIIFSEAYRSNLPITTTFVYSVITSIFKDFGLFAFMLIKNNKNIWTKLKEIYKNKPKGFWLTAIGAISGGPIGFSLTTATILYNGAAYGSALSNFSPIIVLILSRLFLKTKISKIGWLGVILTIVGFIGLSISKSISSNQSFAFSMKTFIGIILAMLAVLTWSVETFLAEYVEKLGDQSLNTNEKLLIKSTISAPFMIIFLLPISFLFSYIFKTYDLTSKMLQTIFSNSMGWLILSSIALTITFGRILYWKSIEHAGGGRADVLYYLTIIMVPLLTIFLYLINANGFADPSGIFEWKFWIFVTIQLLGIILIIVTTENNKNKNLLIKAKALK